VGTSDQKDAAVEKVRPLNATQTRNLTALVKGDFQVMRSELQQFAAEQKHNKTEEIKAQASFKRMEEVKAAAIEVCREYQKKMQELSYQAQKDGISLSYTGVASERVSVNDSTINAKIQQAHSEIDLELRIALATLERKEIQAQRKILVASITQDAEDILNSIPTAQQLMVEAAEEREQRKAAAITQ